MLRRLLLATAPAPLIDAVVTILVFTVDLRGVIGFSSFGVLVYYGVINASAFTQPADQRRGSRTLNILGVAGCAALVATLPITSVIAGLVMFAAGLFGRLLVLYLPRDRIPD